MNFVASYLQNLKSFICSTCAGSTPRLNVYSTTCERPGMQSLASTFTLCEHLTPYMQQWAQCVVIVQNVKFVLVSMPLGPLYPSHTITSGLLFPVVPFSRSQLTRVLTHHSAEMQLSKSAQIAASRTKATINARTYTRMHVALWCFPSTLCSRFIDRTASTLTGLVIRSKCRGKYGKVLSSYDQSKSIAKLLPK